MCVCVWVGVQAGVRACACVRACARARVHVCARARARDGTVGSRSPGALPFKDHARSPRPRLPPPVVRPPPARLRLLLLGPVEDVLRAQHRQDREDLLAAPQVHARDKDLRGRRRRPGRGVLGPARRGEGLGRLLRYLPLRPLCGAGFGAGTPRKAVATPVARVCGSRHLARHGFERLEKHTWAHPRKLPSRPPCSWVAPGGTLPSSCPAV